MTAYSQAYQDHYGSLPPVVRLLCQGMDETEQYLERVRMALGFDAEWNPRRIREHSAPNNTSVRWMDKARSMNGLGDMNTLIGEMCAWMDLIEEKQDQIAARLPEPQAKRPIGRPPGSGKSAA